MKKLATSAILLTVLVLIATFTHAQSKKSADAPDKALMQQVMDAWSTMDANKPAAFYSKSPDNVFGSCTFSAMRITLLSPVGPGARQRCHCFLK